MFIQSKHRTKYYFIELYDSRHTLTGQTQSNLKGTEMPKIASMLDLFETFEGNRVVLSKDYCTVVRNRNVTCRRCVEACVTGCISIAVNEIATAPEKCIGCATCATACPTGAFGAIRPTDEELLSKAKTALELTGGKVMVVCEQYLRSIDGSISASIDFEKLVVVACLSRVDEAFLLSLVTAGVLEIKLVRADCSTCDNSSGIQTAREVVDTTNIILEAWANNISIEIVDEIPPSIDLSTDKEYDSSKREFFTGLFQSAVTTAGSLASSKVDETLGTEEKVEKTRLKVNRDGALPRFFPNRRKIVLESLAALGKPKEVLIATRLWGHVVIDAELCNSCTMCATFCPTGAISKFKENDDIFGVEFKPTLCLKCRTCTDICITKAIKLSDEVFSADIYSKTSERITMKPVIRPLGAKISQKDLSRKLLGKDFFGE